MLVSGWKVIIPIWPVVANVNEWRQMWEMTTTDLCDRLRAAEDELLAIERAIPFGRDPDAQIIATIHVSLAADLPGLISRIEGQPTSEGYQLTLKCLDGFELNLSKCDFDGTTLGSTYRELELRTRDLFCDILEEYERNGISPTP